MNYVLLKRENKFKKTDLGNKIIFINTYKINN